MGSFLREGPLVGPLRNWGPEKGQRTTHVIRQVWGISGCARMRPESIEAPGCRLSFS